MVRTLTAAVMPVTVKAPRWWDGAVYAGGGDCAVDGVGTVTGVTAVMAVAPGV